MIFAKWFTRTSSEEDSTLALAAPETPPYSASTLADMDTPDCLMTSSIEHHIVLFFSEQRKVMASPRVRNTNG